MAYAGTILAGVQVFFSAAADVLRRIPLPECGAGSFPEDGERAQSTAAVSGDGDSSADAVPGVCGFSRFRLPLRWGAFDDAVSGREVDSHHAAAGTMMTWMFFDRGHLPGHALGLRGAGLGAGTGDGTRWRTRA